MADNGHKRPGGGGGPFGHQGPGQKADNFWKSIGRLFKYMGVYRVMIIVSFAFSAISTVFFVVGPKTSVMLLLNLLQAFCQNFR